MGSRIDQFRSEREGAKAARLPSVVACTGMYWEGPSTHWNTLDRPCAPTGVLLHTGPHWSETLGRPWKRTGVHWESLGCSGQSLDAHWDTLGRPREPTGTH